ncbi:MAG TPA: non-homologous end-joining DNA ligase, partial [Jiangellaceae bacterium]|nr:non-homologous end-joining DNA ligase [Jiangellaceae bacterium]
MPTSNNSHFRKERVRVEGRTITLSNQDKVLFPDSGTTKGELIDYLRRLAPVMLPHLQGRPITRKRWPDGTGEDSFFQRDLDSSTPKWVPRQAVEHSERTVRYVVAADEATLTWLGQTACIELHVPQWRFTTEGLRGDPDRLVLDLDPGPGAGLAECAEVALAARELLDGVGLSSVPVTSGSKGLHLYAAIRDHTSDQAQEFAEELAEQLRQQLPKLVITKMKRSLREKKVFIDHSQNNASKTTVSPYSPRGRGRALVAAPRAWAEVAEPSRLEQLEMAQVLERIGDGDPLAELLDNEPDRLAIYRSMRDATKTAEPVPEAGAPPPEPGEQPLFVVQEHHASSLHWDFRLENDGVLVSWAVPKDIPSDSGQNRLAVHTEDHPMEYAQFEGTIARGEYGAGEVTIWDSGTYNPVKWRDDEVIVDLRGERTQGRYALIQTGG